MNKQIDLSKMSEQDFEVLAVRLAKELRVGDVVCFDGDLGAGKTTLARILIRRMTKDKELNVPSPTFTIVQQYDTEQGEVWHFDLYRLINSDEVVEIGFEEALSRGISLIEWSERLGPYMPNDRLVCQIDFVKPDDTHRRLTLTAHGSWKTRLENMNV